MQSDRSLRSAFLTTTVIGMILWLVPCGSMHAYVACVDWAVIGNQQIPNVVTLQNVFLLCVVGVSIGFVAQTSAVLGGAIKSELFTMFAPIACGIILGIVQGFFVATDLWGNSAFNIPLRSLTVRLLSGAFCGFVVVPAVMTASVLFRGFRSTKSRTDAPPIEWDENQKRIEEMVQWARKEQDKGN